MDEVGPKAVRTLQEILEQGDWSKNLPLVDVFFEKLHQILGHDYEQPQWLTELLEEGQQPDATVAVDTNDPYPLQSPKMVKVKKQISKLIVKYMITNIVLPPYLIPNLKQINSKEKE